MDRKINSVLPTTPSPGLKVGDLVRYIGDDYSGLTDIVLIVDDISDPPWVFCKRKRSGTDTPGFTFEDVELITE